MKLRQILKLGAALAVCLNLASAKSLEQIKKDGVITIATEGVYSPFSFHNEKDELMGYDVEIARAVADKLGLKPKFIEASWDAMLAAFDAGKADTVFNQARRRYDRRRRDVLRLQKAAPKSAYKAYSCRRGSDVHCCDRT